MAFRNWRTRPRDGQRYPVQIVDEIHTIEFHDDNNTYGFYLQEAPVSTLSGVPAPAITVKINNSAQTELTEQSRNQAPSSLEYVVDYDESTYFATGFIECNSAQNGEEVIVDYWGLGAVVHSDNIATILADELIPGSLEIQDDLDVGGNFSVAGIVDMNWIPRVAVITSSQSWVVPADVTKVYVKVIGGGGGGGSGFNILNGRGQSGGGGGGGGVSEKAITGLIPGASVSVTIGAGGTGAAAGTTNDGSAGGSSSFGSHCSATGGAGGGGSTTPEGGSGGIGSDGDLNYSSGSGGTGIYFLTNSSSIILVAGGGAGGGAGAAGPQFSNGANGFAYGGGGSGGSAHSDDATDRGGGDGAAGVVIIWY
jgi:hypothetical protein